MTKNLHQRCGPSIINAYDFADSVPHGWPETYIDGRYVPARPLGGMVRWKAALLVLTGRADALIWPKQGDRP